MANTLRSSIDALANNFATSIVAAIKAASLDDILTLSGATSAHREPAAAPAAPSRVRSRPTRPAAPAAKASPPAAAARPATSAHAGRSAAALPKKTESGRLRRRSPAEIAKALAAVVELVRKNPKGLRAEQIRAQLKMEAKEMPRILKEGLTKKALRSKGQKRSTTYTAA